jgi:hypothetical protein
LDIARLKRCASQEFKNGASLEQTERINEQPEVVKTTRLTEAAQ